MGWSHMIGAFVVFKTLQISITTVSTYSTLTLYSLDKNSQVKLTMTLMLVMLPGFKRR
jgi:hypothetical protein